MQQQLNSLLNHIRGAWRFRWWALATIWTICLVGWMLIMMMPDVYEARARVYLDTQSALRPLLKGIAIEPDVESNLDLVRQALLSRPNLQKVARETELDLHAKTPEAMDLLVDGLAKRIVIQPDAPSRSSATDGVYRISFKDNSRAKSLQLVQRLLDSLVEDTLGSKRSGQADAQRFLQEQIADYERRLSEAETKVSDFKKQHVGSMPDAGGDYFGRLQTEMAGLEQTRQSLALAKAREAEMQKQLSGEEPYLFGFENPAPTPTATQNASGNGNSNGDVGWRIRELEGRLQDLRLKYTDKHPEVLAVQQEIKELQARQAEELERLRKRQPATGSLSQSLKVNPVFSSLEVEHKQTEVEIAELKAELAQRQTRVAELHQRVDTVPEVEAELARLTRDYEVTRTEYQQLVQRMQTAQLSEQADQTGVVKFQVIDPPNAAFDPVAPKRFLLLTGVLIAGLAAGGGLAYLLNLIRSVFYDTRTLADLTGLPVLGVVSRAWVARHQTQSRLRLLVFAGSLMLTFAMFAATVLWEAPVVRIIQSAIG
jgi:polysaccharide chain length determinant protein (PEP-CTERM system associated)